MLYEGKAGLTSRRVRSLVTQAFLPMSNIIKKNNKRNRMTLFPERDLSDAWGCLRVAQGTSAHLGTYIVISSSFWSSIPYVASPSQLYKNIYYNLIFRIQAGVYLSFYYILILNIWKIPRPTKVRKRFFHIIYTKTNRQQMLSMSHDVQLHCFVHHLLRIYDLRIKTREPHTRPTRP